MSREPLRTRGVAECWGCPKPTKGWKRPTFSTAAAALRHHEATGHRHWSIPKSWLDRYGVTNMAGFWAAVRKQQEEAARLAAGGER